MWAEFGVSAEELREHFSGPSFLAWNRMGNLRGYAGPLPQSYIDNQAGERFAWLYLCRTVLSKLSWAHIRRAPAEQAEAGSVS